MAALDANTLTDLLIDILSSAEYEKMEAEGRAAKALHMEWHETQDRYVTTGKTIRTPAFTPATPPASVEREHEPGENHDYAPSICRVCGQHGYVRVSIEPQRAAEARD
jgi:hypothetical protein